MIDINFDYSKPRAKIIEGMKNTIEEIENLEKPAINDEEFRKKYSNVFFNEDAYKYLYCMPARHNRADEYKEFNKLTQEYIDEALKKAEQIKEICLVNDIIDVYNGKYKTYEDYIKHVTSKEHKFVYAGQNMISVIRESTFNYLFCKKNLKTKREVKSE